MKDVRLHSRGSVICTLRPFWLVLCVKESDSHHVRFFFLCITVRYPSALPQSLSSPIRTLLSLRVPIHLLSRLSSAPVPTFKKQAHGGNHSGTSPNIKRGDQRKHRERPSYFLPLRTSRLTSHALRLTSTHILHPILSPSSSEPAFWLPLSASTLQSAESKCNTNSIRSTYLPAASQGPHAVRGPCFSAVCCRFSAESEDRLLNNATGGLIVRRQILPVLGAGHRLSNKAKRAGRQT